MKAYREIPLQAKNKYLLPLLYFFGPLQDTKGSFSDLNKQKLTCILWSFGQVLINAERHEEHKELVWY